MQLTTFLFVIVTLNFLLVHNVLAQSKNVCINNPQMQQERSHELQQLVMQDQKIRKDINAWTKIELAKVAQKDPKLRKRVGEIAAEGCLKSSRDYIAAALIFQHGDTPNHYFQAYLWAKQALDLGDENAKSMIALTIDRYLISRGKKQLFGSQYFRSSNTRGCYCREQTEITFPDSLRQQYLGKTLAEGSKEYSAFFNQGKKCSDVECAHALEPTPRGTVSGLW